MQFSNAYLEYPVLRLHVVCGYNANTLVGSLLTCASFM